MSELDDQEMQAKILKYGSVQETQPNRPGLMLARALRGTRDFINDSPLFGSSDLGNLVMGHAPEAIEDYAYGGKPYTGSGWTTKADPRILDIAAMPMVGGGLGKLARSAATPKSELARALVGEQSVVDNEARRNFLKQSSALVGASAGGAAVPDVVKALMKEVAPAVAVQGGKAAAMGAVEAALAGGLKFFKGAVGKTKNWERYNAAWDASPEYAAVKNAPLVEYEKASNLFRENFPKDTPYTKFDELVDSWNTGSTLSPEEQGVWKESIDYFLKHPDSGKLLSKALEGVDPKKVDPDFLARILTWEANPSMKKIPGANVQPSKKYYSKEGSGSSLKDPKNLADFEHFIITGELRKGAHPDLIHNSLVDLPENSKLKPLTNHSLEISGQQTEIREAKNAAEEAAFRASPEGKLDTAWSESPEIQRHYDRFKNGETRTFDELKDAFLKRYKP